MSNKILTAAGLPHSETSGGEFLGDLGWVGPAADRRCKLRSLFFQALANNSIQERTYLMLVG
eukprot:12909742-Prorocentrum_lima.AAC.1